jgi:hypothetical protein
MLPQPGRVAEGVAADENPDPEPLGPCGERREQRPGLEIGAGRAARLDPMIAVPGAVEAELLKPPPALDVLLPTEVLVGADAEPKRTRSRHNAKGNSFERIGE